MPFRIDDLIFATSALALGGAVALTGGGTRPLGAMETAHPSTPSAIQQSAADGPAPLPVKATHPMPVQTDVGEHSDDVTIEQAVTQIPDEVHQRDTEQERHRERRSHERDYEYEDD